MNKPITDYIKTCSNDTLHKLFEQIINEMNKRKASESKKEFLTGAEKRRYEIGTKIRCAGMKG